MSTLPVPHLSPQEYLAIERDSATFEKGQGRHEYFAGQMFAMSGASRKHNLISGNIFAKLHAHLAGHPCEAYVNDMRVKVDSSGLYTYPDVIIVCDKPQFEDDEVDTLLNPQIIIEVLSKSTESYDRGKKFEHYRRLPSLDEYLLVSQDEPHIEHFVKQSDAHWLLSEATGLDASIEIPGVDYRLLLADVYAKVPFGEK